MDRKRKQQREQWAKVQRSRRERDEPRTMPSPAETMAELLRRACDLVKAARPSLLGIHECAPEQYNLPDAERMRHFGYDLPLVPFDTGDDYAQAIKDPVGETGGCVEVLRRPDGSLGTVILLRTKFGDETPEGMALQALNIAFLFHEEGHVDDIERGIHIVHGRKIDAGAMEEYAHHFACKRIMEASRIDRLASDNLIPGLYAFLMAFYVEDLLRQHERCQHEPQRRAAQHVFESSEFPVYLDFARNHLWLFKRGG